MGEPSTTRHLVTVAITIAFGTSFACGSMTKAELHCEEAVAWLTTCCPGFVVPSNYCVHEEPTEVKGCAGPAHYEGGQDPVLSVAESDCIRGSSCSELVAKDICRHAMEAKVVTFVDGGAPKPTDLPDAVCR